MRYVDTAAKPLQVGAQTVGVREVIAHAINTDARFNQDGPSIRASMRIEQALTESEQTNVVALKDDDWTRLCEALDKPTAGYVLTPARALLPFIEAVLEAPEERAAPKLAAE